MISFFYGMKNIVNLNGHITKKIKNSGLTRCIQDLSSTMIVSLLLITFVKIYMETKNDFLMIPSLLILMTGRNKKDTKRNF